jgi:hypothetical protein
MPMEEDNVTRTGTGTGTAERDPTCERSNRCPQDRKRRHYRGIYEDGEVHEQGGRSVARAVHLRHGQHDP